VLSTAGLVLSINEAGRRRFELSNTDGKASALWADLWKNGQREAAMAAFEKARTEGESIFQGEFRTAAGEVAWWDVKLTRVGADDSAPERIIAVARDVTERGQAEQHLRAEQGEAAQKLAASEERFHAFMDRIPAIAFLKDEKGRYIFMNK